MPAENERGSVVPIHVCISSAALRVSFADMLTLSVLIRYCVMMVGEPFEDLPELLLEPDEPEEELLLPCPDAGTAIAPELVVPLPALEDAPPQADMSRVSRRRMLPSSSACRL